MRATHPERTVLSGVNAEFLESLYRQYLADAGTVAPEWQGFFAALQREGGNGGAAATAAQPHAAEAPAEQVSLVEGQPAKQAAVFRLIDTYRRFGHTQARLDPLGRPHMKNPPSLALARYGLNEADLDALFSTGALVAPPRQSLRKIVEQLRATYCGTVGVEFFTIPDDAQRAWLRQVMEGTRNHPQFVTGVKRAVLEKLIDAEVFEKFLHTQFLGQKRFSLEGAESMIVMMEGLVEQAAELGVEEIVIGMPHRGRLNTLVNVMGKKPETVFAEFEDAYEVNDLTGSGDVKYHLGYSSDREIDGHKLHLSLSFNPSHLEAVNPVVLGNVRARQDRRDDRRQNRILPVLMHGDAAFAGQGTVMETLNLSQLEGYRTGGTIHIIVNNQIGFTTPPRMSRSSLYPSDPSKLLDVPVLHVNGDDPEAVLHVIKLAVDFRQEFHTDIVIDLFCYRRLGHNETDEPAFTQPLTYELIRKLPTTAELYAAHLIETRVLTRQEVEGLRAAARERLTAALEKTRTEKVEPVRDTLSGAWSGLARGIMAQGISLTEVSADVLRPIGRALAVMPEGFTPHPRLKRQLEQRGQMVEGKLPIDWGTAELLAYGSLVAEGFNVRLSGQDSGRGTFSHRHANLVDTTNGKDYVPLQHLREGQGRFEVIDSPLSEAGVLGFEFGYSLAEPFALVIWEAQFGDFANGAQVLIDQFIAASEEKWLRMSGLVLLLPHGFEGQGPEHSSARLERFLQMCAHENWQVCNATTPAQFFHLLRRQLHRNFRKPLVVMSPKSLLRHPQAVSSVEDLIKGHFREVLYEKEELPAGRVRRIVFCSGKIYYELLAERTRRKLDHTALVRIEQLYPFPREQVSTVFAQYPKAREVFWVQEEPKNMGAWDFVTHRFRELAGSRQPEFIGRRAAAAPATGSHRVHDEEQHRLVAQALA
ncbi:MAG: 2-oxoglutarate dehydrogenase E1 component [Candidatus Lambdaproteobacteria bacterium]|nr:2-oxoglutarate dehydrogenase E1 component [Candidatus Lambdaproteobacteria bacterium]